jgi:histidinol-phosphate aminotransferase
MTTRLTEAVAAGDVTVADLAHHGDADLVPGLIDLAVNVRSSGTPRWLAALIRDTDLSAYPDQRPAADAIAARHRRASNEVLLTAGAAEAFVLLARTMRPQPAVIVHPQFTEPEAAMRAAGHPVSRVVLPFPFLLARGLVPAEADLVFVGSPTNPTFVAHSRQAILALRRPGETFPGLAPGWIRVAVRYTTTSDRFALALRAVISGADGRPS